jgi:hypothetical protein
MTVKIIPISPDYRENFDKVFKKQTSCASANKGLSACGHNPASEIQGVINSIPPTPLIAPDGTGSASSAPRGDAKIYMTTPLPASWGMVDGRPF